MVRTLLHLLNGDFGPGGIIFAVVSAAFCIWMFVHAVRHEEYVWAALIFCFSIFTAIWYYFVVYRMTESTSGNPLAGFELPGAADRRRIAQLEADIHHLDKAHLHQQLADIYFSQGKLDKAEESYRAAYERDPKDEDIRAHLGNCLARKGKHAEALPLLAGVCAQNPRHDYGYTLMSLAETQAAVKQDEAALATWRQVLAMYGYPRARVQFAELLIKRKEFPEARKSLQEVIDDHPHATKFDRKREKVWFNKAKSLLRGIP